MPNEAFQEVEEKSVPWQDLSIFNNQPGDEADVYFFSRTTLMVPRAQPTLMAPKPQCPSSGFVSSNS